MKLPKLSTAVLKGIEKYSNQCTGIFITAEGDTACVIGGALGVYKIRTWELYPGAKAESWYLAMSKFQEEWGISIWDANDGGLDREEIYGMLKAIGE